MLGWNINLCYATILRWFPHELVIYPLLLKEKKYVNYLFFYLNKAVIRNGVVKFCGKYKSSFVALLYNDNILQSFSFSGWLRKIYSIQILNLHKNFSVLLRKLIVLYYYILLTNVIWRFGLSDALKYSNK